MSARNYLSDRERNINKILDSLPDINQQKFNYRSIQDYPVVPNGNNLINRNINYSFEVQPYVLESIERCGTPFSDFFSDSDAGTPDIRSDESDSSAGSVLKRNTDEASHTLAAEWERIERTIYGEEGEKVTRPQLADECNQWRELHPQLRIVGRRIPLPEKRLSCRQMDHDEIIAIHYSDYEQFSESEERLSQSSTDVTPQNSPRTSIVEEPRVAREKMLTFQNKYEDSDLPDTFYSILQITPLHIRSSSVRKRQNSSIVKSEISSSKWMRNGRPDTSVNCHRNSAKSCLSLDNRNSSNLVLSDHSKLVHNRVLTARHREAMKLEPLYTPDTHNVIYDSKYCNGTSTVNYFSKKISLPPLLMEDDKKRVVSPKRLVNSKHRGTTKAFYHLDKRYH